MVSACRSQGAKLASHTPPCLGSGADAQNLLPYIDERSVQAFT